MHTCFNSIHKQLARKSTKLLHAYQMYGVIRKSCPMEFPLQMSDTECTISKLNFREQDSSRKTYLVLLGFYITSHPKPFLKATSAFFNSLHIFCSFTWSARRRNRRRREARRPRKWRRWRQPRR